MASVDATDAWMMTRNAEECAFFDAMTSLRDTEVHNKGATVSAERNAVPMPSHHGRHEMLDRRSTDLLHDGVRLDAQQFERTLDAWLPEGAEAPDIRPAHAHRGRSHAQRLDDIGAAAEARVDQDRNAALYRFDYFRQRIDGRAPAVLAARAVVGNDDPVHACVSGEHGVLVGEDALEYDLHLGRVA